MSDHDTSTPMLAKSGETSGSAGRSGVSKPAGREESLLAPDAQPEELLERIRFLLTDHSLTARRMAVEAAIRFPDHAGIQNAKRILDDGQVAVGSGSAEPSTKEEFEWLRHPPESVRGKWVAVVNDELVGSADSLIDLTETLRSKQLPKPALVHRIEERAKQS